MGLGLVKLLVLLGRIVRIGDAPIDERRPGGDPLAFLHFLRSEQGQNSIHQQSGVERWSARASSGAFSAARLSKARAESIAGAWAAAVSFNSLRRETGPNSNSSAFE